MFAKELFIHYSSFFNENQINEMTIFLRRCILDESISKRSTSTHRQHAQS